MVPCCRLAVAGFALAMAASPADAQAPARVRGIITAVDAGSITIKQPRGRSLTLRTGPYTIYSKVVRTTLDDIRAGDFVGTASKGPRGHWVAVELVIIPRSMRAGRTGYAGWDPLPDPAAGGTVPNSVATSMTNGVVTSAGKGTSGRTLAVTLVGGKPERIFVPVGAPITRFVRSDRSVAALGAAAFVKTDPGNKIGLIAVGQGITPPM